MGVIFFLTYVPSGWLSDKLPTRWADEHLDGRNRSARTLAEHGTQFRAD